MNQKKQAKQEAPEVCPVCGEDVPRKSLACPECGADHNSGWKEDADTYDGVNLPGDEFDYDEFVKEEFGSSARPAHISAVWWLVGIVLIIALIALYFYTAR
jgi:hypothetical protein